MWTFIAKRLGIALPTVLVVATVSFFLVQLVPGDPAALILGDQAGGAQRAALNHELGLDQPLFTQYTSWLGQAVQGDFGDSFLTGQPVSQALAQAVPVTVSLAVLATLLSVVVGSGLGLLSAVRRGGTADRAVYAVCTVIMAIPGYWLAAVLVLLLAVRVRLFPTGDYVELSQSPGQWLGHLVLPVLALGVPSVARIAFQSRAAVIDVLGQPFVRTLQAAGVPRRRILVRHVLRNAAVPVVTVAGLTFLFLLGGVVIIEAVFNLPGLGTVMLQAVNNHDLTVVQGAVVYFSVLVTMVNLAADLAVGAINPRVRAA
ncbi:ABC transporter permease [Streptomyces sp. S3(2020)]|uniref:ABC transporter permease n=1 Tax=Streptomyces sp. S3(2020) TaxID=2732044 RepID=UPI001489D695|nr:ABC transporter permease [Streptomyces sp. S3(2020)]NNN30756.1 ABC transporter permease [Streptomyces sp. S3(2020)]